MKATPAPSLRRRLLAATAGVLALALLAAGWGLSALFREHAMQQFREGLQGQLDQLTARLDFDAAAQPVVDTAALSDPRWERPYSGLYWQLDGAGRAGVLRSRSLWDQALALPPDNVGARDVHVHEAVGPLGRPVLVLERDVHDPRQPQAGWRLAVAADTAPLDAAVRRFRGQLALSLLVLFALLLAASWIQVLVGLAPLRALREALEAVRGQRAQRLQGRFPAEVQPLVDEFNAVLAHNAAMVEQARKHAGNLAHAVKTPLAVLRQVGDRLLSGAGAAPAGEAAELGRLVHEQVDLAARHVDWHLARSRSAALARPGGRATRVEPVLQGLARVMARVHAQRGLHIEFAPVEPTLAFQGEEQDLQEILGNLLDNACKWARSGIHVRATSAGGAAGRQLRIEVEDDGPGIDDAQRAQAARRGVRLDETLPGSGLGLAIVQDLVGLYGGTLDLQRGERGGLLAVLLLPAA
ncbi:sensor histidine kinase [Ramlibacter sp.]|uniref:sensor histidine kinase n=1 Tax=Ramlibacter sp. TaxID=1917967 RepID=UPI002FCA835A